MNEVIIRTSEVTGKLIMDFSCEGKYTSTQNKIKGTILKEHSENPEKWIGLCPQCQKVFTEE